MLFQLGKSRATDVERALQIDVDHSAKTIWRQLLRGTKKVPGCTVHNDVDLAELLDSLRNRFLDVFRLSNISRNRNRVPAILVDRLRSGYEVVHLPADERHGRTCFRKRTEIGRAHV